MSWQSRAEAAASRAFSITYADAIADGCDESEAIELAADAADDVYFDHTVSEDYE